MAKGFIRLTDKADGLEFLTPIGKIGQIFATPTSGTGLYLDGTDAVAFFVVETLDDIEELIEKAS